MHPIILWTVGGAGMFSAVTAAIVTHHFDMRRLRPQLAAMSEHLKSCTKRMNAGRYDLALARHIMDEAVALDRHRRSLDKGDPVISAILADIGQEAILSIKNIQADLCNGWDV
jgi:hypothetical protein